MELYDIRKKLFNEMRLYSKIWTVVLFDEDLVSTHQKIYQKRSSRSLGLCRDVVNLGMSLSVLGMSLSVFMPMQ